MVRPRTRSRCRFALDASGRTGVIARRGFRRHEPGFLTQAFIGEWEREGGWDLPDHSHTLVETYAEGWAWSVPLSDTVRQVGVAVDGATTQGDGAARRLHSTYRAEIAKTQQINALMAGATLGRAWACDASLYSSHRYAGPQFLLVGDAASAIDPLSSFGVKKALASAWVGAIAVHTSLTHPDRQAMALDFFANRERQVYAANLRRSWAFAHEAQARHSHPFWAERAGAGRPRRTARSTRTRCSDSRGAGGLSAAEAEPGARAGALERDRDQTMRADPRPRNRARRGALAPEAPDGVRFLAGVDLLKLGEMACRHRQVPELFDAYCRTYGTVPLPSLLGSLSVLLARGVLGTR